MDMKINKHPLHDQLLSEIYYFFGMGMYLKKIKTFKPDRYRKRYGIASDKVASLKTFCRNRVWNTQYVENDNYAEIRFGY